MSCYSVSCMVSPDAQDLYRMSFGSKSKAPISVLMFNVYLFCCFISKDSKDDIMCHFKYRNFVRTSLSWGFTPVVSIFSRHVAFMHQIWNIKFDTCWHSFQKYPIQWWLYGERQCNLVRPCFRNQIMFLVFNSALKPNLGSVSKIKIRLSLKWYNVRKI